MKKSSYIAPAVISILLLIYFLFIAALFLFFNINIWIKILVCIFSLSFIGVVLFVFIERIKELKSGELNDISKY